MTETLEFFKPRAINQETHNKAVSWLTDVKDKLQAEADTQATVGYIASLDLGTQSSERLFPTGTIDERANRFLEGIEGNAWSEHMQSKLADLQDQRVAFKEETGTDIILVQLAAIRIFNDTPSFYNS